MLERTVLLGRLIVEYMNVGYLGQCLSRRHVSGCNVSLRANVRNKIRKHFDTQMQSTQT